MNEIVKRATITDICAHRDAALASMRLATEAMAEGARLAEESIRHGQEAYGSAIFTLADRSQSDAYQRLFMRIDPEQSLEAYRQQLDARVWMRLLTLTGMEHMMDRTEKEKFYNQLCGSVLELTEDNALATFQTLMGDAQLIFQRGLARAFISLDRRFRSHDAFGLGARIIFTRVFDEWGSWSHWTPMRDIICDVERVFAVLDGNRPDPQGLINAIDASRGRGTLDPRQSTTESTYFRIKGFMNGNAHLWFTRDDLVEKANAVLASYYGAVLPDGVPADVTEQDIRTRSTAICKDLSFYATPTDVAVRMTDDLHIGSRSRVLEPSAGEGGIIKHLLATGAIVDAIEVDPSRAASLRRLSHLGKLSVNHANFLTMHPSPVYDFVVMNPPFYGTHYMQHVMHAFEFLKPGGRLVSVLPSSVEFGTSKAHVAFRKWLEKHSTWPRSIVQDLPLESFAQSGTRISTCLISLRRP